MEPWQIDDAQRLRTLWESHKDETRVSQTEFGAESGIGTQGMVHQYVNGVTPLNLSAVGKFAKAFKVRIDDISPTLADQVRELYTLCDSQKNVDYDVSPQVREAIQREIRAAMANLKNS